MSIADPSAKTEKLLRVVVFLTGFLEGSTGVVLLFFPGIYKAVFGLDPSFDSYYIQQIGMFEVLVGAFIAYGAFDRQLRPFALCALWFHLVCLVFEVWYITCVYPYHDLKFWSFVAFDVFHVVMIALLVWLLRANHIPLHEPVRAD